MKVKFLTLGCKVNQYETQSLKEQFLSLGHQISPDKADLYVINTCTVTKRADYKSKEAILQARRENPQAKVAVCGCLAVLNRDFIEQLGVDYIIPQDKKHLLSNIVLNLPVDSKEAAQYSSGVWGLKITNFPNRRAFVKIQDGCNNFCSFCKIPYLRGKSQSRRMEEVIKEVENLSLWHKEIVFCGVNLGLYGRELNYTLDDLVEKTLNLPTLGRLRLSSLEPFFINRSLFSFLNHEKLCPHFHFSFQSGDDEVLYYMNKKDKVSLYEELVNLARSIFPDVAISCDIIVGFPYETEETFRNTVKFLERVKPMRMHIFTFSPRENTPLWLIKIKNQKDISKRYRYLNTLAKDFSSQYRDRFIGRILKVVTENIEDDFISGHAENYLKVSIKDKVPLGEIFSVRIEKNEQDKLFGSVVK
ncbi:MAG: tRNA (N(6)-L-threonylcarbamoyladenosine(37)-C(2))-methylthiotransferase MtaB [Candidatus Omnitrophica bacterium]|jgi:threonylcarbamoyladenosine tRNA methylthiotransferase MtaB|nr:tRNA (N(6)-L-threonylcarbamoyladenosine(37)-C(2))-methylthiotransferase MtaB [Candidatus Omnitrophota bacterium]